MYNILCVVFFLVKDWSSTWRYMLRLQTSHRKLQLVKIIEKYPRRLGFTWLHTGGTMVDDGCKKCGGEGNAATAATWAVSVFGPGFLDVELGRRFIEKLTYTILFYLQGFAWIWRFSHSKGSMSGECLICESNWRWWKT